MVAAKAMVKNPDDSVAESQGEIPSVVHVQVTLADGVRIPR